MIIAGLICIILGLFFWPLLILGVILIIIGVVQKNNDAKDTESDVEKLQAEVERLNKIIAAQQSAAEVPEEPLMEDADAAGEEAAAPSAE